MSTIQETLGKRLRAARKRRRMTLRDVAERSGVRMQQISKYECGDNNVTVPRLVALSRALGVPAGELVEGL